MGMFDTITVGEKNGQVKCWENVMIDCSLGDTVPSIGGHRNYSIAMKEGGYVNVRKNKIDSWTNEPFCRIVVDKYGYPFNPDNTDNQSYFF